MRFIIHSSFAIILMVKRELVVFLNLSSWCLVIDVRFLLLVPLVCLQFVIMVFPDHSHLLRIIRLFLCDDTLHSLGSLNVK